MPNPNPHQVPRGGALLVQRLALPTSSPFTWHSAPPREWLLAVRAALLPRRPPPPPSSASTPALPPPLPPALAAALPPTLLSGLPAGCAQLALFSLRRAREAEGMAEAVRLAEAMLARHPGEPSPSPSPLPLP